jgi:hypothetical protein
LRKISLKYSGKCVKCGREIPAGEVAFWEKDGGIWHLNCQAGIAQGTQEYAPRDVDAESWDEGGWQDAPREYGEVRKPPRARKRRFHLRPQLVGTILVTIIALSAGLAIGPFLGRPTTVTTTTTVTNVVTDTVIVTVTVTTTTGGTQPPTTTTAQPPLGKWISSSTNVVSYLQAANYAGQSKIVEGKIVRTYASSKGTVFLDFHDPYQGYFEVTIFASDVKNFPFSPVSFYLNKEVRVTGTIEMYQGAPEIIVHSPSQIEAAYMGFNYP